jgi:YaiO family outer membrane protein
MRTASILALAILHVSSAVATPLERGLAAKASGDLLRATAELGKAVQAEPRNAEAWFHYGTVLGWQQRYDEAASALDRGLAVAPGDFDLRLARARVKAWQADYDGASRDLDALAAAYPGNEEVLVMQGRVASWKRQPEQAADRFREVLSRNPRQIDALTGMGDLARESGRKAEARDYYQQALAIDPTPDVTRRLEMLEADRDWRLDAGVTASSLSGSGSDWWSLWTQVSHRAGPGSLWGRIEQGERFGLQDTLLEGGWEGRVGEDISMKFLLGGSPDANWAADWYGEMGVRWMLVEHGPEPVFELRHADYASGAVWTFRTGLEYDFGSGWRAGLRWLHQEFDDGEATEGWIASLERELGEGWWLRVGNAGGAESLSSQTIGQSGGIRRSTTWFAGLRGPLGSGEDRGWRVDLEFEDVRGGSDRRGIALGVFQRF